MKTKFMMGLLVLFLLVGTGTALGAPKVNTFERPAAGIAYTLSQWGQDGWSAPWSEGMSNRSLIDTQHSYRGGKSLRIFYPKGKFDPLESGASAPFALTPGNEYYLSYWMRLSDDFSWGTTLYAGKLGLGLAGGGSCSGGMVCDGYNGFSSRMIWLSGGRAAIYYYHMGNAGQYGDYVELKNSSGSTIVYPKGQWFNIVQRLKVNTVTNGQANPDGEIEIWYNGQPAAKKTGLRFVRNGDKIDKAYFSSFFGGATDEFAPANDSYVWYDDLKVSTSRSEICELASGGCHTRKIEAEDYTYMSGVMTEPTPDTGGGLNVGGIDSQDWMAYTGINIPSAGVYQIDYRVSSINNGGQISLDLNAGGGNGTVLGTINVPNTGSWSSYRTISHTVTIPAGTHQFGIYAVTGGFDLNWWRLTKLY
ncbi:carbohydrate-binding protein [Paenibacillus daejeonensis]|uniref:carbohydrate-binding protein n=1 Tax=Paenibacillus daejeonensis TaxID=135193 RepID=UPI00036ED628|nr:carbohydrate-binding protein [Paenibacillus daejeonensis]